MITSLIKKLLQPSSLQPITEAQSRFIDKIKSDLSNPNNFKYWQCTHHNRLNFLGHTISDTVHKLHFDVPNPKCYNIEYNAGTKEIYIHGLSVPQNVLKSELHTLLMKCIATCIQKHTQQTQTREDQIILKYKL